MLHEINTLETTTVTISKDCCKCNTGKWIIYDRNWLLDNLDVEMTVLKEAKVFHDRRKAEIEKKLKGEKQ